MKNWKLLTLPKILMLVGAMWIIIFNLLYASSNIESKYIFYGWPENGITLILIGIIYILIPFSVKVGIWSKIWALLITVISIIIIIGLLIGSPVQYISMLPHITMATGAILWIFINK